MSYNRDRSRSPVNKEIRSTNSDSDDSSVIEMATQISQIELSMANNLVPTYSGGSKDLAYFIRQSEKYLTLLKTTDNALFNSLLLEQVKAKLSGPARDVIINISYNDWESLKKALTARFGDPRSEELLANDLNTSIQVPPQTFSEFHDEISQKLQILKKHLAINTENEDVRISKEMMYTEQALIVFKAGLLNPYRDHLLHISVLSLEQALYECKKLDNERSQIEFANFLRSQKAPRNRQSQNHQNSNSFNNNQPRYQNHFPFNRNSNINNNLFKHQASYQHPPQRPNFNRQNFSNSKNQINFQKPQFQPLNGQSQPSTNYNKPTPMSTSTAHTFNRPKPQQNYFRQTGPPRVAVEELFNVENLNGENNLQDLNQEDVQFDNFENENETQDF